MKRILPLLLLLSPLSLAAQTVTNVRAAQRVGTKLVDVYYNLSATEVVTVEVAISGDGGAAYALSAHSLRGDVGGGVAPGSNKHVVWDAGVDWNGQFSELVKFRVTASGTSPMSEEFSLIPGGSFTMGRTSGDDDFLDADAPPTTVTVGAFYMAKMETTWSKWNEVRTWALAQENLPQSYTFLDERGSRGKAADHPVDSVDWHDVLKWCNARSEKEGLTPVYYTVDGNVYRTQYGALVVNWSANGYRLPTEAEWEKAARGGVEGKRFPWGEDTISHAQANYFGRPLYAYDQSPTHDYHPDYNDGTEPYTSPVGSFAANGYGLHDMAGNVREWCWDWYEASYYGTETTDPRGPASGTDRVVRGGDWDSNAIAVRCSYRGGWNRPGFRIARSSAP